MNSASSKPRVQKQEVVEKSYDDEDPEPADEKSMQVISEKINEKILKNAKLDGKYIKSINQYRKNVKRIEMITRQQVSNTMLHIASYG